MIVDQCSILYVKPDAREETHAKALRALGFSVDVTEELPPSERLLAYHAVIVRVDATCNLPALGARLRARPRFGRRVLIALVPVDTSPRQRREAAMCGFDVTLSDTCSARDLAAHVLRHLRPFPEYRCLLRTSKSRRKAA